MKIITQTSTEILIASPKKSLVDSILMAGFSLFFVNSFIAAPLYMLDIGSSISVLTESTKVSCDRVNPRQVNCEFIQSDFFSFGQQKS